MSLVVDRFELGPIGTNCYVVRAASDAVEAVVIDPGSDASMLELELVRLGTTCVGILVTHGHWDHIGAVADLAEELGVEVWMPAGDSQMLEHYDEYAPAGTDGRPYVPDVKLAGDETIELGGVTFETIPVPGHTPGHVAFLAGGCLFSGDLLFAGSVGRVDLPGGDWETLLASVRLLSDRLPGDTVVYPGHGPKTTLGYELDRNPFLAELRA
jgi:hydroxyacylglutathione hydrolase